MTVVLPVSRRNLCGSRPTIQVKPPVNLKVSAAQGSYQPIQMFRIFSALLVLSGCALSMPPPAGLNLKPAKALGEEQPKAFLNETGKKDLVPLGSQTLILTKNRKYKKPLSNRSFFGVVTEEPITARPIARPSPKTLPSSANYGVNPVLQTNFVDAQGRVLKNVVSIPIRVGDAQIKQVSSSSASAALVEGEAENGVRVKFGQAPTIPI
ncbi:hypothetical protein NECAME_11222 [Necator americanus]|uniref:Uncharacterized protein n=1 Tax=Necator americanus TaxID=51031 RepID=W2T886_NECAM|nr:hypothetical protein NECAME_11222 [Necator americanus]ETN77207.1 hypothetical protein NECAME_11222 [Necator americanus]